MPHHISQWVDAELVTAMFGWPWHVFLSTLKDLSFGGLDKSLQCSAFGFILFLVCGLIKASNGQQLKKSLPYFLTKTSLREKHVRHKRQKHTS